MNVTKKIALGIAVSFFANFAFAQSLQEGIASIDSHKYAKAKKNFEDMVAKEPSGENYFYLGNTYLTQFEPNFDKASEYFNKGKAADKKDHLNAIGLAAVKLGKGDKSGIADIQNIVKDSKEKDSEVLYRAAEALTMFEKTSSPDLAVTYLEKAIEREQKNGVPAYYYYTLGDAYRLKLTNNPQVAGSAMSAYDNALIKAKNKASVYTRMGTLWMAAQQWKLAKESMDKAVSADATYAPAYKALAGYHMRYQQNADATKDLMNYAKYADEDPYTQLEISKLFFMNEDYANSKAILDKVFNQVDDPIKHKLKAYLLYADGDYAQALQSLQTFYSSADKSRHLPSDKGLEGLIAAGLAKDEQDAAKKSALMAESKQKIAVAKNAKDETFDWDMELLKIQGGGASSSAAAQGPTNPKIEALKQKVAANPNDLESLVNLGTAYQEAENWNGAILTWDKMIAASPDWAYSYYAKASSYQNLGKTDLAEAGYQKFIDVVASKPAAEQMPLNETMSYAYYMVAYYNVEKNMAKAKEYASKSVMLNPNYEDAVKLNAELMKQQ